ncbi:hypothetical protein T440DRAFT_480280 [Plenodomus tracheiphilus IPT5]|uniref:Uncharacterized protein n=1 Tax=Plenodomus tracheiphilus IPT5 TaxID=1408161 RepID=A0A6A7B454_9PLEO|nr:hypothetical protein T440DRAFT_480280 [Plenodomus tracheiphilus IPT5]
MGASITAPLTPKAIFHSILLHPYSYNLTAATATPKRSTLAAITSASAETTSYRPAHQPRLHLLHVPKRSASRPAESSSQVLESLIYRVEADDSHKTINPHSAHSHLHGSALPSRCMTACNQNYINISENRQDGLEHREETPWYWRLVALTASWMIVAGYLLLPGLYAIDAQLNFSPAVLSVFVVALLTAGYSFTALLCFACRDASFQAYSVFLYGHTPKHPHSQNTNTIHRPTLASSALGLITIIYNLFATRAYHWDNASIAGSVLSGTATFLYGSVFLFRTHRISKSKRPPPPRATWSEPNYYTNYNANMYPTATRSPSRTPETTSYAHAHTYTEDEGVTHQMRILLRQRDPTPSPNAKSTFQIALPMDEAQERRDRSQELVGTPGPAYTNASRDRVDSSSRPDSLGEQQAWERWQERGRTAARPSSTGGRSSHSRNLSREERRTEIELGGL